VLLSPLPHTRSATAPASARCEELTPATARGEHRSAEQPSNLRKASSHALCRVAALIALSAAIRNARHRRDPAHGGTVSRRASRSGCARPGDSNRVRSVSETARHHRRCATFPNGRQQSHFLGFGVAHDSCCFTRIPSRVYLFACRISPRQVVWTLPAA
jgi:hypothetical protein